jgi:hypothetical protein
VDDFHGFDLNRNVLERPVASLSGALLIQLLLVNGRG